MLEEDEARYEEHFERHIKAGLTGTLGFLRFVGQLVDMYVPRAVDTFIITAGGSQPKKHHADPATGGAHGDRRHAAPGPDMEDGPAV